MSEWIIWEWTQHYSYCLHKRIFFNVFFLCLKFFLNKFSLYRNKRKLRRETIYKWQASWGGFKMRSTDFTNQEKKVFLLIIDHEIRRRRPQMWQEVWNGVSLQVTQPQVLFPHTTYKLVADWNRAVSYSWRGCMVKRAQCFNSQQFHQTSGLRNHEL